MADETYNLADLWELISDQVPERVALMCGDDTLTYRELEQRANQCANALAEQGVGEGDHVGVYLTNGLEWFYALLGCFKLRAVPININYRYVSEELRYLFDDADVCAVIANGEFAPRVRDVASNIESLHTVLYVGEVPNGEYQDSECDLAAVITNASDARPHCSRSNDDRYIIYTGGTTGMPKGVVWRQEDAFFACIGGGDPMRLQGPVTSRDELLERIIDFDFVAFPVAPMMHAAAQWTSLSWLLCGAAVVMHPGSFDAKFVLEACQNRKVSTLIVVGDAMVRPLVDEWDKSGPYDLSGMYAIGSGGAPLTALLKKKLAEILPNVSINDGFGSSETGAQGAHRVQPGETGGATKFVPTGADTAVLDDDLNVVVPGSQTVGKIALSGRIPIGYYNAPEKTAETFVEANGKRWVLTGDMATVNDDGEILLFGRGSQTINTGGEKVHPEEVEAALKLHQGVFDAVVVGIPDERFGQRVCAVISERGEHGVSAEELTDHCRQHIAGYKVPKDILVTTEVRRSPVGKADYRWAASYAESELAH